MPAIRTALCRGLAIICLFASAPGASTTLADAVFLWAAGPGQRAEPAGDDCDQDCREHGCSAFFHRCQCCGPTLVIPQARKHELAVFSWPQPPFAVEHHGGKRPGYEAQPFRPPIG